MSEWVSVRKSSLMDDSTGWDGRTEKGLEYYFKTLIEQNNKIISLLETIDENIRDLTL